MLEKRLKTLSTQYPRYGFKKLFGLIRQQNYSCNHKQDHRTYCDLS